MIIIPEISIFEGVNANFLKKIEKFLLFGVSACKIRTTFFRGFVPEENAGKRKKFDKFYNLWFNKKKNTGAMPAEMLLYFLYNAKGRRLL